MDFREGEPPIREQPRKSPSWIGLIVDDVDIVNFVDDSTIYKERENIDDWHLYKMQLQSFWNGFLTTKENTHTLYLISMFENDTD